MVTVEARAVGRDNNFNLLRMVAAGMVLVSHAWPLALGQTAIEPLVTTTGYKLGTTAVTIFFAISGFFITKSFAKRESLGDFALARVARIYPGLLAVLLLSVLALGPAITNLPLGAYWRDRHSWTYLLHNLSLMRPQWTLPGVFAANPIVAVNGSLWTLWPEVRCYAVVVVAGLLLLTRPATFWLLLAVAATAVFVVPQTEGCNLLATESKLTLPFAIGAGAYVYRRHIPVSVVLAVALGSLAAVSKGGPVYPFAHALAISYAALWFGFADLPGLRTYNRLGDYSYGLYIYAFPVGQLVVAAFPGIAPWSLAALALPLTLVLAVASWKWIERPALAHRHWLWARLRLRRMRAAADV